MCGIAGILDFDQRPIDRGTLGRMRETLVHSGPDESDVFVEPGIGLAHQRLSIIEQPRT